MGQCAGASSKKSQPLQCYWKQPADTHKYEKMNLPKLSFQGMLGNFKIKNCPFPKISIRVEFPGIQTFILTPKRLRYDMSATWAFEQKIILNKTLYQMKKSFVQIYIEDDEERIVGQLKINLFLISNGPYHQDFAIKLKKGINTRLSFDMKISQVIEVELESLEAEIDLVTKHPDERFLFTIKTIVGNMSTLEVNSRESYPVRVMLDGNDSSSEDNQLTRKKSATEQIIPAGNNLTWSNKVSNLMPSIGIKTLVSQLHHSYFQILVWKVFDKKITSSYNQKLQLFGECYIALHKMFVMDPKQNNIDSQQRIIETTEKLSHHGHQIGRGKFLFKVKNQKYLKQMQVMVRTEEGIRVYSPVVFDKRSKKKDSGCQQLVYVIKITDQIQQLAEKLDAMETEQTFRSIESRKIKVQIQELLQSLFEILLKSSKELPNCYFYSSKTEMIKAQQLFIQIGFKMTDYLQQQDTLINELCWKILIALLKRGQFSLAHLGFDEKEKEEFKSSSKSALLESKYEVALTYQRFLSKQLDLSLKSLSYKGLEIEKTFAQMFLAYGYFRIPYFRHKFLQAIIQDNDPEIPEWRGIQFSLQEDLNQQENIEGPNTFTVLCDWQHTFYKCFEKQQKAIADHNELQESLELINWQNQMKKRGESFFYFIIYWVDYIEDSVHKTRDIQWRYFPGYNKIIKCFLVQLKKRSILQYPDALKRACFKLLSNEKLLYPIISIILSKGNIYEPLTVLQSIEFINDIFLKLDNDNRKIPGSFDYYPLYKAIKIILEGDFSFAVSKTLVMIYFHYKMFHLQFRRNLCMLLLGKVFFKLFLHWSYNVRDTFSHLLIMRIYRQSLTLDNSLSSDMRIFQQKMNEEIRKRYQELMDSLENLSSLKKESNRSEMSNNYEKHFYKNMKKKLINKKRKKSKEILSEKQAEYNLSFVGPQSPISVKTNELLLLTDQPEMSSKKRLERSQSQNIKSSLKITYKSKARQSDEVIRLKKNISDFKHEIYHINEGKKIPISKTAEIVNKYQEKDFEINQISKEQIHYVDSALNKFKIIRQILNEHYNDKDWAIPSIRMEMPLDIRESRPEKIDSWCQ